MKKIASKGAAENQAFIWMLYYDLEKTDGYVHGTKAVVSHFLALNKTNEFVVGTYGNGKKRGNRGR